MVDISRVVDLGGADVFVNTLRIGVTKPEQIAYNNIPGTLVTAGAPSNNIVIGSTSITSGAGAVRTLYDNAGVLGEFTPAQLTSQIQTFTGSLSGAVPLSGGGTTNFLRADGTWAPPPNTGGLVIGSTTITGGSTTQVLYNNAGVIGNYTATQLTALINQFTTSTAGIVPASPGGTTHFLRSDNSWAVPAYPTPGGSSGQVQINSSGVFAGITNTQLTADINVFTNTLSGAVPGSGGGSTNFLRADGTWAAPAGGSGSPGGSNGQVQYNNSGAFGGLTNTQLTADINVFTSSLSGAVPGSGGGTSNFLRADGTWVAPGGSTGTSPFFNVKDYGATGNGTTNDITAINAAIAAASAAGGGVVFFPAGTYLSNGIVVPSYVTLQGAGMHATTIVNTGGTNDETIIIVMVMSGGGLGVNWPTANTVYTISHPVDWSNQITFTTHSQAGNFAPGNFINISGGLNGTGQWYPSFWTKVTAVNTTTGVVTLEENIPFRGNMMVRAQIIDSIPENITVRDMTLQAGLDAALSCFGGKNILFENVKALQGAGTGGNGLLVMGNCRWSGFRNCMTDFGGYGFELYSCQQCFIEGCSTYGGSWGQPVFSAQAGGFYLLDGGCVDCCVINNTISIPSGSPGGNCIAVVNSSTRNKIIGNTIFGVQDGGFTGINIGDGDPTQATDNIADDGTSTYNVVMGNCIAGTPDSSSNIGIAMGNGVCMGNVLQNLQLGIFPGGNGDNLVLSGNSFYQVANPISSTSGQPGNVSWRENWPIGFKSMSSGTATPSAAGGGSWMIGQSGAQNVTNFTGCQIGDEINLFFLDGLTTLVHGSGLALANSTSVVGVQNGIMSFVLGPFGSWYEKSRSSPTTFDGDA